MKDGQSLDKCRVVGGALPEVSMSKSVILSEIADRRIKPPSIKSDIKEDLQKCEMIPPLLLFCKHR